MHQDSMANYNNQTKVQQYATLLSNGYLQHDRPSTSWHHGASANVCNHVCAAPKKSAHAATLDADGWRGSTLGWVK
eukprot:4588340-Karenia_brevis.AAC.1